MPVYRAVCANIRNNPDLPPWQVRKVYAVVWPQSVVRRAIQVMRRINGFRTGPASIASWAEV